MKFFNKLIFCSCVFSLLTQYICAADALSKAEVEVTQGITIEQLNLDNKDWFESKFVETFLSEYIPLTFTIGPKDAPRVVGPQDTEEKKALLTETAAEEFEEYVIKPKDGYRALKIMVDGKPAGAILFRLRDKEKIIYLAQFFVCKEFSRKGLATYALEIEMRKSFPEYRRYEVLTRYQNEAGCGLYGKLKYLEDKTGEIAKSYGYDPSRYKSLYKEF